MRARQRARTGHRARAATPHFARRPSRRYGSDALSRRHRRQGRGRWPWRAGARASGVGGRRAGAHVARGWGFRHLVYTDIARDGMQTRHRCGGLRAHGAGLRASGSSRRGGVATRGRHRALAPSGRSCIEGVIAGPRRLRGRFSVEEGVAHATRPPGVRKPPPWPPILWDGRRAMLTKRVIPCMDVKDGRVVKGVNFVNLRDAGDPIELAQRYDERARRRGDLPRHHGHERRPRHHGGPRQPRERGSCTCRTAWAAASAAWPTFGTMIAAGADKVSVNSAAVADPVAHHAGGRSRSAARRYSAPSTRSRWPGNPNKWEVYVHGGRKATGIDAVAWAAEAARRGAGEILLTSMDRDGSRDGFDCALTRAVARAVDVPVIASRRRGQAGAFRAGHPGRRGRRRAGRERLSLRRAHRPPGEGAHGEARASPCGCKAPERESGQIARAPSAQASAVSPRPFPKPRTRCLCRRTSKTVMMVPARSRRAPMLPPRTRSRHA